MRWRANCRDFCRIQDDPIRLKCGSSVLFSKCDRGRLHAAVASFAAELAGRSSSRLPEKRDDGRIGKSRRIALTVIEVADNAQGELSAHLITVSKLNGEKIACTVECITHDGQSLGIINRPDAARYYHFVLLLVTDFLALKRGKCTKIPHSSFGVSGNGIDDGSINRRQLWIFFGY
jgi:hypothetical protein